MEDGYWVHGMAIDGFVCTLVGWHSVMAGDFLEMSGWR